MLVCFMLRITLYPFWICNHPDEKKRGGCFALIVFLMFVNASAHRAVDWSAACDFDIF